jgi:hypothetical protein
MKQIEPISIWQAGVNKQGVVLNSYVISDNLLSSATFYYGIATEALESLTQGNLTMTGAAYDLYSSNEDAWSWVSTQLGVTIIGEFVPVVPDPVVPEPLV